MPVHTTAMFAASDDVPSDVTARAALQAAGFAIGPADSRAPWGILLGTNSLPSWSAMTSAQRCALEGQMWKAKDGVTTIMLHADAPAAAVAAFEHVLAASQWHLSVNQAQAGDLHGQLLDIGGAQ